MFICNLGDYFFKERIERDKTKLLHYPHKHKLITLLKYRELNAKDLQMQTFHPCNAQGDKL